MAAIEATEHSGGIQGQTICSIDDWQTLTLLQQTNIRAAAALDALTEQDE